MCVFGEGDGLQTEIVVFKNQNIKAENRRKTIKTSREPKEKEVLKGDKETH